MIRENQAILNKINVILDMILIFVAIIISYVIRFYVLETHETFIKLAVYIRFCIFLIPIQFIIYSSFSLYSSFRSKHFHKEALLIFNANIILVLVILTLLFIFKIIDISRLVIFIFYIVYTFLILGKRYYLKKFLHSIRSKSYNLKSVVIIGSGETACKYLSVIKENPEFGYSYLGYVSNDSSMEGNNLGKFKDLKRVLKSEKIDEIVCALDIKDYNHIEDVVSVCEQTGTKISIIPFCYKFIPSKPYIDQIGNIPLVNIRKIPLDNIINSCMKRLVDVFGSIFLIILFSPVMIIASIGIKLSSKGPIIFKQERIGLNKEIFVMYKFRSMVINDVSDSSWSTDNDKRKTKFGSFLRKYSLDELPQLFNVIKGDMSLVGPRPEIPHFVRNFQKEIPLYMVKHQVKPGMTGLAQINGFRGNTSIKKRIEHDIYYIENWSIVLDIYILFMTIFKGFKNTETIV